MSSRARARLGVVGLLLIAACRDRMRAIEAADLGPEQPGVRKGPDHRPGQPCLVCHSDGGRTDPIFSLAGTIYRDKASQAGLWPVDVIFVDSGGASYKTTTNCAGNFFVRPGEFSPKFPIWVSIRFGDAADVTTDMESPIWREGSCSTCHSDPVGPASSGHVFLTDLPDSDLPTMGCR